jgi:hypothetical protein
MMELFIAARLLMTEMICVGSVSEYVPGNGVAQLNLIE